MTLVIGDVEAGASDGTLTPAAAKALSDLKGFLPYKTYRPIDTVWMLGLNGPHQFLSGTNGQRHEFFMQSTVVSPTVVNVTMLRLASGVPEAAPLNSPSSLLIDTSFKIEVGETVVVGTSRVDGKRGLILLVTAAPR